MEPNCRIHNSPESSIVCDAIEVTSQLKTMIHDSEADYLSMRQEEKLQARLAELAANGEDKQSVSNQSKPSHKIVTESFDENYHGTLSRVFMEQCNATGSPWFPQSGDKIIYNRRLHGKFINGHFPSLSTEQRILPSMLPRRKKSKQSDKPTPHDEKEDDSDESKKLQSWLGTVLFARCCFPSPSASESQTFDVASPLVAIGIQFHYNWLSKDVHVLYWRPCQVEILNQACGSCPSCGLDLTDSFITPAWRSSLDGLVPPYPLSLTNRLSLPTGLTNYTIDKLDKCWVSLKKRISHGDDVDSFTPSKSFMDSTNLIDIPSRFQYIFDDEDENLGTISNSYDKETSSGDDTEKLLLQNAAFLPAWTKFGTDDHEVIITRATNISSVGSDGKSNDLHDSLIANPYLCLNTIHDQVKKRHYRDMFAVAHDLREAFVNSVLYIMKEKLTTKQLKKDLCYDIIDRLFNSRREIQSDDEASTGVVKKTVIVFPTDYSNLLPKEKNILKRLELVRKVYAMALFSLIDPITAEIVYGIEKNDNSSKVEGPKEDQLKLRKTLGRILGSLSHDRCIFRRPLSRTLPLPNVEVRIKPPSEIIDHSATVIDKADIELAPTDYENNAALTCALFRNSSKVVKVNIAYQSHLKKDKMKQPIYLEPNDYSDNVPLVRILFCSSERKTIQVSIKCEGMDSIPAKAKPVIIDNPNESESVQSEDEYVNFSEPITYVPDEYELNETLVQALHCRPRRRNICARCKISRNGLLTCRVRKAHSNYDFIWNDFIVNVGGIDGILKKLKPDFTSQQSSALCIDNKFNTDQSHVHSNAPIDKPVTITSATKDSVNDDGDEEVEPIEEDNDLPPHEQLSRAEELLFLARKALCAVEDDLKSKPCLSEEFLRTSGLLDPEDGHYEVCALCGLGGDVLCCESCPIVSHAKCVGLETIPTGDWYCKQCTLSKESQSEGQKDAETLDDSKIVNLDDNNIVDTDQLEKMLDELRSRRQKDKHDSRRDENDDGDDESECDQDVKPSAIKIGMKVVKRELFQMVGEVISLPSRNDPYYEVQYIDGELEKLDLNEMREGIALFENLGGSDVFDENELSPLRSRRQRRQLVPYGNNSSLSASRNKKRKLSEVNPVAPDSKRKRGRPRKTNENRNTIKTMNAPDSKRKRGRPRKTDENRNTIKTTNAPPTEEKRGRGRPRKDKPRKIQENVESDTEDQRLTIDDLQWIPKAGYADPSHTYYCTVENDTSATIARKVGVEWVDVANEAENSVRFPSLQDKRVRFRKGTLVRIPEHFSLKKVLQLTE